MDIFKQAMIDMRAQEQPKECDHDWRHFSDGQKCATNAVTMTGNIFRMVSKCVPNALQNKDPAFSITACHQTRTTLTTCLERKMLTQKRNISLDTSLS